MNVMPFIPKEESSLPDFYTIEISFLDGKSEQFDVASHRLGDQMLELVTKDDLWKWVPLNGVKTISFDKRFSALVDSKSKRDARV